LTPAASCCISLHLAATATVAAQVLPLPPLPLLLVSLILSFPIVACCCDRRTVTPLPEQAVLFFCFLRTFRLAHSVGCFLAGTCLRIVELRPQISRPARVHIKLKAPTSKISSQAYFALYELAPPHRASAVKLMI